MWSKVRSSSVQYSTVVIDEDTGVRRGDGAIQSHDEHSTVQYSDRQKQREQKEKYCGDGKEGGT